MKIDRIDVIPIKMPLEREFRAATFTIDVRCTLIIRIGTDEGAEGSIFIGDIRAEQAEVVAIIRDEMAPRLIGRDPTRISDCFAALIGMSGGVHRRARIMEAISALDVALWDLLGRISGQSVHRLLGGAQQKVRAIATIGYQTDGDHPTDAEEAALRREEGFGGVKLRIGFSDAKTEAKRAIAVREAIGDDLIMICDANQGWDRFEAVRFAQMAKDLDIDWLEEPTNWRDYASGMAHVRTAGQIAVGAGQNETSSAGCRDLLAAGALDVLNFDSSMGGGVSEWIRAAHLAEAFGVRVAHHEEPLISMHLLGALPYGLYSEYFSQARDPLTPLIAPEQPEIRDGHVTVPDKPGFGIVMDDDFIAKYRV